MFEGDQYYEFGETRYPQRSLIQPMRYWQNKWVVMLWRPKV